MQIISAIVFCLIAVGLYKMRRDAAVSSLILSLTSLVFHRGSLNLTIDIVSVLLALLAVRGIYSYVRLSRSGLSV